MMQDLPEIEVFRLPEVPVESGEEPQLHSGMSRARFLYIAGAGIAFSGSLASFMGGSAGARVSFPGSGEFPIGLWWPPPPSETTVERYREIRNANFNFVIGGNGVSSSPTTASALDAARANGLKFVVFDSRLYRAINGESARSASDFSRTYEEEDESSPVHLLLERGLEGSGGPSRSTSSLSERKAAVSERVREILASHDSHPAFDGLDLYDEPNARLFEMVRHAKNILAKERRAVLPYVNVWPSHSAPAALGVQSYGGYLSRYMKQVDPPVLSFDHYPLLRGRGVTRDYFSNWATIRNYAKRYGVPAWGFIQSVDFDGSRVGLAYRRRPDRAELFWQVNVALAYGAKGLQYFTYWTPGSDPRVKFGAALVSRGGQRTPLYGHAASVNSYLKKIGRVMLPLVSESVYHARERRPPKGAVAFRPGAFVKSVSGSPVILGQFRKPGAGGKERHILVTNRSPHARAKTILIANGQVSGIYRFNPGANGFSRVRARKVQGTFRIGVKLPPGAAQLFILRRR